MTRAWRTFWHLLKLIWRESRILGRFLITLPASLPAVLAIPQVQNVLGLSVPWYAAFATGLVLASSRVVWVLADATLKYEEQLSPKLIVDLMTAAEL